MTKGKNIDWLGKILSVVLVPIIVLLIGIKIGSMATRNESEIDQLCLEECKRRGEEYWGVEISHSIGKCSVICVCRDSFEACNLTEND